MGGIFSLLVMSTFGRLPPAELLPRYEILHRDLEHGYEIRRYPRSKAVQTEVPLSDEPFTPARSRRRNRNKDGSDGRGFWSRGLTNILNYAVRGGGDQFPEDMDVEVMDAGGARGGNLGASFDPGAVRIRREGDSDPPSDDGSHSSRSSSSSSAGGVRDAAAEDAAAEDLAMKQQQEARSNNRHHAQAMRAMGRYYKQIYDKETEMTRVSNVFNSALAFPSFVFQHFRPRFYRLAGGDVDVPTATTDASDRQAPPQSQHDRLRIRTYFHSPIFFPHRTTRQEENVKVEEFQKPIFDDWMNEKERERMHKMRQLRYQEVEDPLMEKRPAPRLRWPMDGSTGGTSGGENVDDAVSREEKEEQEEEREADGQTSLPPRGRVRVSRQGDDEGRGPHGAIPKPDDPHLRLVDVPERTVAVMTVPQTNPFRVLSSVNNGDNQLPTSDWIGSAQDDPDAGFEQVMASSFIEIMRRTARVAAESIEDRFINSGANLSQVLRPPAARTYDKDYGIYSEYTRRKLRREELERNRLHLSVDTRWWRTELVDYNPLWTLPGLRTKELHVPVQLRVVRPQQQQQQQQQQQSQTNTHINNNDIDNKPKDAATAPVAATRRGTPTTAPDAPDAPSAEQASTPNSDNIEKNSDDARDDGRRGLNPRSSLKPDEHPVAASSHSNNNPAAVSSVSPNTASTASATTAKTGGVSEQQQQQNRQARGNRTAKKKKKPKPVAPPSPPVPSGSPMSMVNFVVGTIVEVSEHPEADKLYIEKIDIGEQDLTEQVNNGAAEQQQQQQQKTKKKRKKRPVEDLTTADENGIKNGGGVGLGGIESQQYDDDDDDETEEAEMSSSSTSNLPPKESSRAPKLRTILSGLREHYPNKEDLVGRRVLVVENLEPRKMRGIKSAGMILCGSSVEDVEKASGGEDDEEGDNNNMIGGGDDDGDTDGGDGPSLPPPPPQTRLVKLLDIPAGVPNGERVVFPPPHDGPAAPVLKKKLKKCYEQIAGDLHTNDDGIVCFGDLPFVTSMGPVSCKSVPPGSPVG